MYPMLATKTRSKQCQERTFPEKRRRFWCRPHGYQKVAEHIGLRRRKGGTKTAQTGTLGALKNAKIKRYYRWKETPDPLPKPLTPNKCSRVKFFFDEDVKRLLFVRLFVCSFSLVLLYYVPLIVRFRPPFARRFFRENSLSLDARKRWLPTFCKGQKREKFCASPLHTFKKTKVGGGENGSPRRSPPKISTRLLVFGFREWIKWPGRRSIARGTARKSLVGW